MKGFSSVSSSSAARILLIDDNHLGLIARKNVVEELGHGITTAATGQEALECFAKQTFDLVITDYKMPKMNGVEMIGQIRSCAPHVPIIVVSGFVDALGLNESNTGADMVIQKSATEVQHLVRS